MVWCDFSSTRLSHNLRMQSTPTQAGKPRDANDGYVCVIFRSIEVSIPACHAGDPGSIPGGRACGFRSGHTPHTHEITGARSFATLQHRTAASATELRCHRIHKLAEVGFDPTTCGLWAHRADHCATLLMMRPTFRPEPMTFNFRSQRHIVLCGCVCVVVVKSLYVAVMCVCGCVCVSGWCE